MSTELPPRYAQKIAASVKRLAPNTPVEIVNADTIKINNRSIPLLNLYRISLIDEERSEQEIDEHIDKFLLKIISLDLEQTNSFINIRDNIFPRIAAKPLPGSVLDNALYTPFANDTIIRYVVDLPDLLATITIPQIEEWGITVDQIDAIARTNLVRETLDFQPQIIQTPEGGQAAIITCSDCYASSRILLPTLYEYLSPFLKGDFYVGIPARDTIWCFSRTPKEMVDRLRVKIAEDFKRYPYPISPELFIVTLDGVAGA